MYHLQLTAKQYSASTVVLTSLWEIDEDGTRRMLAYDSRAIPTIQGGLFEEPPSEFLETVLDRLTQTAKLWRHTHQ